MSKDIESRMRELADWYFKFSAGNSEPHATIQRGVYVDIRRALGDDANDAYDDLLDATNDYATRGELRDTLVVREQIIAAERAAEDALKRAPRPFGRGDDGAKHLQNALDELRRARVYADVYVDVARQDAGLPR